MFNTRTSNFTDSLLMHHVHTHHLKSYLKYKIILVTLSFPQVFVLTKQAYRSCLVKAAPATSSAGEDGMFSGGMVV